MCEDSIKAPPLFSLRTTALSHGWHECSPLVWCDGGQCLQIVERVNSGACIVAVTQEKRAKRHVHLRISLRAGTVEEEEWANLRNRVERMLGLDQDLTSFYALCANHPTLHVIPDIGGGRLIRSPSMYENIIKVLCSTNTSWPQAVKMINRLGQLGPQVRHYACCTAWPTPREVLRAGTDYLLDVCRVGYRAETIIAFCQELTDKSIDVESLWDQAEVDDPASSESILQTLRSIRGIGPASSHALLSLLGRHDRLEIDSATVAHVARTHTKGRKPTGKEVEAIYKPFGQWRNLVYWCENWLQWETAKRILASTPA